MKPQAKWFPGPDDAPRWEISHFSMGMSHFKNAKATVSKRMVEAFDHMSNPSRLVCVTDFEPFFKSTTYGIALVVY